MTAVVAAEISPDDTMEIMGLPQSEMSQQLLMLDVDDQEDLSDGFTADIFRDWIDALK